MENTEQKTFAALSQSPYTVTLGGREFEFRPVSLSDRQEISAVSSTIDVSGMMGGDENVFRNALAAGKYSRQIAKIITTGAHVRGWSLPMRNLRLFGLSIRIPVGISCAKARKRKLFRYVYDRACIEEVYEAVMQIFIHANPAFFLNITTSLSQENTMKPTKETAATAPGQSKPE